ncbi:MAG: hypothetical protein M1818_008229 [Claussenomyces sp. TS43310]|nr:MAG: hypothetical protein M1818_008229 [Claussenomyces sp. TS43310]
MMLVSAIGGQYLWVDRICIIQDDEADKARQIPMMDKIYASTCLTIIAASGSGARDGLAGCISRPRRLKQDSVNVSEDLTLLVVPQVGETGYRICTWRTRAWTLQEKVCSRRTVTFTDDLMFWSCCEQDWFENLSFEHIPDFICNAKLTNMALAGYYEPYEARVQRKNGEAYKVPFPSWSWLGWQGRGSLATQESLGIDPELNFFRLDLQGHVRHLLPYSKESSAMKVDMSKVSASTSALWKGKEGVTLGTNLQSRNEPFRDSGRILFWTSHARLCLRKGTRRYSSAYEVQEWQILSAAGEKVGHLKTSDVPEVREDELFSFIVVSRAYIEYKAVIALSELNLLLVSWNDREAYLASRICAAIVEEKAWVKADREWVLVTLQ